MKKFIRYVFILFLIGIVACAPSSKMVKEGVIYKTRIYVGIYEKSVNFGDKFYNIQTSQYIFTLSENPDIPNGALCYMRMESPDRRFHPEIAYQLAPKYFTWNGAEREYNIYNDVRVLFER